MKKDAAPIALRRPFVRLARSLITPRVLELLRQHASPAEVAAAIPTFHPNDPQGPWADFYAELFVTYSKIAAAAGQDARVWKAARPSLEVPLNPYSKKWIKGHAGELAVELSRQQHALVRAVVARGYGKGARPEEMQQHLKKVVGLTTRQEVAVANFRERTLEETGDEDLADARTDRYAQKQLAYRTENIARTENRFAVEHGRQDEWLQARDDGEISDQSRRQWVSAPASDRLCEICEDLDGQEVGLDEPFVTTDGVEVDCPPAHPSCFPGNTLVSPIGGVSAQTVRTVKGDLVVLRTALGKELTCTPNHPILTPGGWVAASLLRPGDDVLRCVDVDRLAANMGHTQHRPPMIDKIANFASELRSPRLRVVPGSPQDFHGDGELGEVTVVTLDRKLRGQAGRNQNGLDYSLDRRTPGASSLSALCAFLQLGHFYLCAKHRSMSGLRQALALLWTRATHAHEHGRASVSPRNAPFSQAERDNISADTEAVGQRLLAFPRAVALDQVRDIYSVSLGHFGTPVYNLETSSHLYVAQGLITHNCRCTCTVSIVVD